MPAPRCVGAVPSAALLFEALPPRLGASEEQWQDHLGQLDALRKSGLSAVNVPEVLDGAYRTVEPRAFAAALQRRLGVPALLNRVTVHHALPALQGWAAETRQSTGIRDLVLVGGESGRTRYPGVGVNDALRGLRPATERAGGSLGVVTIPHRRRPDLDEPQRLGAKQAAGARFAVSQILCDADAAIALQRDLRAATPQDQAPLSLVWSLAPVAKRRDLEFLQWLGVDLPEATRKRLLATAPDGRLAASHALNEGLARSLLAAAERDGLPAPGFCVEHVMLSNIEAAIDLVDRVRTLSRDFGGLRPTAYPVAAAW